MKKPIIFITTSNISTQKLATITGDTSLIYSDRLTAEAVIKAGGLPLYIPALSLLKNEDIEKYIDQADGILITGADTDTNPKYYHEKLTYLTSRIDDERDSIDIHLIKRAYAQKTPLFGICKGMQLINVALGGSLYQNITQQCLNCFDHDRQTGIRKNITHMATLANGSLLLKIFQKKVIGLNGGHKQAVKELAAGLIPTAVAKDGIIEAYEGTGSFIHGIQFHAELRLSDKKYFTLFTEFIKQCKTKN